MSGYCASDDAKDCKLLADCPLCLSCWAHCWCYDDDADECKHGIPKVDECDACVGTEPE